MRQIGFLGDELFLMNTKQDIDFSRGMLVHSCLRIIDSGSIFMNPG